VTELLLNRTLDPADYDRFTEELQVINSYSLDGQHPHRRWEYALALHAIWRHARGVWQRTQVLPASLIYDVGGAGTTFHHMLTAWTGGTVIVIDPAVGTVPVEQWATSGSMLADVITCVSVIEHVPDDEAFLYAVSCLLAPGGLLVVTMDYWNKCGVDTAEHRDLRQRLYCPQTYQQLRGKAQALHLETFGGVDPRYHGPQVHDYTFASLVLRKRP